jgi:formylglycine-generating enzyme required for sulfatase activity
MVNAPYVVFFCVVDSPAVRCASPATAGSDPASRMTCISDWQIRAPRAFPPSWACAWGDDRYGLWADFALQADALVQRMRWIEPGSFVMGSPADEVDRHENEGPQHHVTISRGFWLADTACTQALWQAVTGKNPSQFHAKNGGGPEHPVENVSWDMTQNFLGKLGDLTPNCQATLPTEAEWEYACRADSGTPFSFGGNITANAVNYNALFPYGEAAKVEMRRFTLPVKDLPANAWGLYQMHGNVWEWCADEWRKYHVQAVTDPGDVLTTLGVVRGGSWGDSAANARSACRFAVRPEMIDYRTGFRFILR